MPKGCYKPYSSLTMRQRQRRIQAMIGTKGSSGSGSGSASPEVMQPVCIKEEFLLEAAEIVVDKEEGSVPREIHQRTKSEDSSGKALKLECIYYFAEANKDGRRKRTKDNLKYPDENSSSSLENDDDDRIPNPPSPVAWVTPKKKKNMTVKDSSINGGVGKPETTSIGVQCVPEEFDDVQLLASNEDMEGLLSWKDEVLKEIRDLKRKFGKYMLEEAEAKVEIKRKITDLESHIKDSRTSSSTGSSENEFRDLHSFPVTDVIGLLNLQTTIMENDKYREYLICFLKERSSNILYKCSHDNQMRAGLNRTVNDMCSTLMSNELAASFCMKGRSENKMAFEVHFSSIINIIFESLKAKQVPGALYDIVSVKRSIGEWFRVSKYRTEEGKQKRRATSDNSSARVLQRQLGEDLEEVEFFE